MPTSSWGTSLQVGTVAPISPGCPSWGSDQDPPDLLMPGSRPRTGLGGIPQHMSPANCKCSQSKPQKPLQGQRTGRRSRQHEGLHPLPRGHHLLSPSALLGFPRLPPRSPCVWRTCRYPRTPTEDGDLPTVADNRPLQASGTLSSGRHCQGRSGGGVMIYIRFSSLLSGSYAPQPVL